MTAGVVLLSLGVATAMIGRWLTWLYREGESADRTTMIGGLWLGALWATRLGLGTAAVGVTLLLADAVS